MIAVTAETRIADLSHSLCALWEAAEATCDQFSLTRSLTQNLIVVTHRNRLEDTYEMLNGLLNRHPCRAIVVSLAMEGCDLSGELLGQVEVHGRGRAMVLERLTLQTDWSHYPKIPNLIRPLLVNDIPTSVFWAGPLPESLGRITALAQLADHLIVDSTLFDGDDWRALAQLAEHAPFDLAWLRLAPWRRCLAEAFEHFEWQGEDPATTVILEHGPAFGSLAAARCLEHWLFSRLGASVKFHAMDGDGPTGEPWRLDLTHGDVHIQVRHTLEQPRLAVNVTLQDHCLLPSYVQATRGERSRLLAAALDAAQ